MWTPEKKRAYQAIKRNQNKRCSKCGEIKPSDNYYHWSNICKSCRAVQARINRKKNNEHYRQKWKEYEQRKKDKLTHQTMQYEALAYTQMWKACGSDKVEFTKAYKQKNGLVSRQ